MIGAVWSVEWNNPYTEPPDGQPRVLIEVFRPEGHPEVRGINPPTPVEEVYKKVKGSGYSVHWQPVSRPIKQLTQEKLAVIRRKRLERRIRGKYPLLADQIIDDELRKKKEYYQGITDKDIQAAKDEVLDEEEKRLKRLVGEFEGKGR